MSARAYVSLTWIVLSTLLGGLAGCARPTPLPSAPSTPTLIPGWERYTSAEPCGYIIDHPSDMDVTPQGAYNILLTPSAADPGGPAPNFLYVSVIPDGFQDNEPGLIYNFDPAETQTLLDLQVGESRSLREDPTLADWFTYTRLPDERVNNQTAQAYENTQPWEFPPGTEEIRYYLKANDCLYMIGGYLATVGSGQPGWIGKEQFDPIVAAFRLAP